MESKSKGSSPGAFEILLFFAGITMLIGSFVWTIAGLDDKEPDVWKWFSRFALAAICFGFSGVIREIRKLREKDD